MVQGPIIMSSWFFESTRTPRLHMMILPRLAMIGSLFVLSGPLWAQDDLFDAPGGFFDELPKVDPEEISQPLDENPLIKQLLEHSRRGEIQLARSVSSLARVGRWSEVDQLLTEISQRQINEATLTSMYDEIGSAIYLRIKQHSELSDAARKALDQIAKAASARAESSDRLRQAIAQLDSTSVDAQLASRRILLGGGNTAVKELVTAAVLENPPASRDSILRVMLQLSEDGIDALRQLALYGTPSVRANALTSLARISRQRHIADFVTALHAADADSAEKESASRALEQLGQGEPSRGAAIQLLEIEYGDRRDYARRVDNDNAVTTLWSIDQQRTGVTHQPTSALIAAYRDASDAAARLRRVGSLSPDMQGAVLATDLAYRILIDNDWGDSDQVESMRKAYRSGARGASLSSAIEDSISDGNHAATIGLIRLIDTDDFTVLDQNALLGASGALPTPLVQAASSPEPQVRYEAALAAARLAAAAPYAGSSHVKRTLAEMHKLRDEPLAILVETRPDVIIQLESILASLGFDVEVVGSVRELQRSVARGGDLRLILSKTELSDLPAIEMIDIVRRTERGRELPIVLYGHKPDSLAVERWKALTRWIERPVSVAGFDGVMDEISRRRRLPPLSIIDRQRFRDAASQMLDGVAVAN